jgi:alpha-tubulin suppressor-like RCC1 family protein
MLCYGRLGHGDESNQYAPTQIASLRGERVLLASAGSRHSLALNAAGEVFSFGFGGRGRLGHGDNNNQLTPKAIAALRGTRSVAITARGDHSHLPHMGMGVLVSTFLIWAWASS